MIEGRRTSHPLSVLAALAWLTVGMLVEHRLSLASAADMRGQNHAGTILASYGRLPLSFEVNRGQTDPRVRFLARTAHYTVFLTDTELVFAFPKPTGSIHSATITASLAAVTAGYNGLPARLLSHPRAETIVRVHFLGVQHSQLTGVQPLPGRISYFIGNNPRRWHPDVQTFGRVRYHAVYPGIDLQFHGTPGRLEYDWLLRPGADPDKIRLQVQGGRLDLQRGGRLELRAPSVRLLQDPPLIYQVVHGYRRYVSSTYVLSPDHAVRLRLGSYDRRESLVIDPGITTVVGGSDVDGFSSVSVDGAGNPWVVGDSSSIDYPLQGPEQNTKGGEGAAIVVSKLDSNLTTLLSSTYLGGTVSGLPGVASNSVGNDIAVDTAGRPVIVGATNETDFPMVNPFQATSGGGLDGVVVRLEAAGDRISASSYLGGEGIDLAFRVRLDSQNGVVVGMWTNSPGLVTSTGAVQPTYSGGAACSYPGDSTPHACYNSYFIGFGSNFAYTGATYLGAQQDTLFADMALTSSTLVLTGLVGGSGLPTTPDAGQSTFGHAQRNGFLTRLDSWKLAYSSYFGNDTDVEGTALALDTDGTIHVAYSRWLTVGGDTVPRAGLVQWKPIASGYAGVGSLPGGGAALSAAPGYLSVVHRLLISAPPPTVAGIDRVLTVVGDGQAHAGDSLQTFVQEMKLSAGTVSALGPPTVIGSNGDVYGNGATIRWLPDGSLRTYVTGETTASNLSLTAGALRATAWSTIQFGDRSRALFHSSAGVGKGGGPSDGWIGALDLTVAGPGARPTPTPTSTSTATPVPTKAKKCKGGQVKIHRKCACRKGYKMVHGKCQKVHRARSVTRRQS